MNLFAVYISYAFFVSSLCTSFKTNMSYSAESKLLDSDSTSSATNAQNVRTLYLKKVGSALFYGVASFLITVVNKTVLTSWHFPSFLALSIGQMVAGIVILVSKQKSNRYNRICKWNESTIKITQVKMQLVFPEYWFMSFFYCSILVSNVAS